MSADSEESGGEGAVELAKIIPEIFYDVIGRVVPGLIAVWAWTYAFGTNPAKLSDHMFSASKAFSESVFVQASSILFVAYLIGHLISPISSLMHTYVLASFFPRYFSVLHDAVSSGHNPYPSRTQKLLTLEVVKLFGQSDRKVSEAQYRRATYLWYDWIRLANPAAGARLAKMRAEYRMLEGLYVVLVIAILIYPISRWSIPATSSAVSWTFVIGIAVGLTLAAWGAARLFRTFQWAVMNHYYQLRSSGALGAEISEPPPEPEQV